MKRALAILRYLWAIPVVRSLVGEVIYMGAKKIIKKLKEKRDDRLDGLSSTTPLHHSRSAGSST